MTVDPSTLPVIKTEGYGWRRQLPDFRDVLLGEVHPEIFKDPAELPQQASLDAACMPEPFNQLTLGSCTANMAAGVMMYMLAHEGKDVFVPSRLFIYYNERVIEGSTDYDSGATIRDAFKVLNTIGAPPETDWPYDIGSFTQQPPQQAYTDAVLHEATQYMAVEQNEAALMSAIAAGYPVGIGIAVYQSFEGSDVARTGTVPMPGPTDGMLGGHAIWVHGYDRTAQIWKLRNSWGSGWGDHGNFTLPWEYLLNPGLSGDFWACELVS